MIKFFKFKFLKVFIFNLNFLLKNIFLLYNKKNKFGIEIKNNINLKNDLSKKIKEIYKERTDLKEKEKNEEDKNIYCRNCYNIITNKDNKIIINGSFKHIFINPAGIKFEIGCFSKANGCINIGKPTQEYTWFKDYYWNYAICLKCHLHLGWYYQTSGHSFYGLILERIIFHE